MTPRLAYLCSQYPAVSHTFINREIEQLQAQGLEIHPFSMRQGQILEGATPFERSQLRDTWVIHNQPKWRVLLVALTLAARQPLGFLRGLGFALSLHKGRPRETLWALFHFAEACLLVWRMRQLRLDHVHVHFANSETSIALYAHRAFGVTYSFTLHGPDCFYNLELGQFAAKVHHARAIVAISHFARGQILRVAGIEAMAKIAVVHCGVDPSVYLPAQKDSAAPPTIVCTGRMTATKGQSLLIEAAAHLRDEGLDFRLVLIGAGEELERHRQVVAERGLSQLVTLTGALPQEGVRAMLAKADLFVLPSFAEGVPVVLMEAMSMAVPCISTRVGGIAELIEDERDGWLIHSGDLEGLIATLRAALSDPGRLRQVGAAARGKIQAEFDVRQSGRQLARFFGELLA